MKLLTPKQKQLYTENGYLVIDIFSESEIEALSKEYDEIFERKRNENTDATWGGDWKKGNAVEVKSIHGMQMHSAVFTRLLLNEKLLDAYEDIMETKNILLHHTKAHLKPPGKGSPFPMHQDYHYFPYKNDSMVASFISLDASRPENGGLCVYPGSHLLGPQKDMNTDKGWHYLDQDQFSIDRATPLVMKKGQVVIFSYLLVHGSYENTSLAPRRMYLTQLVSAEDEPLKISKSACQGMVLRGSNINMNADISKRNDW